MKQTPTVSIIVPCYNVQMYIEECIDSILAQTLENIEIIAVNDGSTDNTLNILRKYESSESRVKVIDKSNSGYGNSVNQGIASASGLYIGIVESDDFIAPTMYETLYELSFDGICDVVKGNFYDYYTQERVAPESVPNNERHNMPDIQDPFNIRHRPEILWGHPSVWSAIYRCEFLKAYNIKFKEVKGGGWVDNPFFFETLCKAKNIMWTKESLYYYRKTNFESSSNKLTDINLPFVRMMDNLDVIEKNNYTDNITLRYAYARALMYMDGAFSDLNYDENFDDINTYAKELMQRLDYNIIRSDFALHDQYLYFKYASPIKYIQSKAKKILIYNWISFDNEWNWGGGVNIYCRNLVDIILKERPDVTVYFLSSGFAYDGTKAEIYHRKINNVFGDRCHSFEIVNSPIPADQRNLYVNPNVTLENPGLKEIIFDFICKYGEFAAIHFNNIEGLSLDVFDLKSELPDTKFIFSVHNYIPICITGSYFQRHECCICNPEHSAEDCMKCTRVERETNIAWKTYERSKYGQDIQKMISFKRFSNILGLEDLDKEVNVDDILLFAKTAISQINKYCDHILAVSKRVRDIVVSNGFSKDKTAVSYIGTIVARRQVKCSLAPLPDNESCFKIVYLGSDLNYEEKGYPFLLDSLEQLDDVYASKIDMILTVRTPEHAEIYKMLKKFHSVKVINGYTHDDLSHILEGVHLGLVPVLWEDNLPQIAIEMAAYGVPVLSSNAGGASELCDSELFKFESGNSNDLLAKIMHFVDKPEDLNKYWEHHSSLVTMQQHWQELASYYGLSTTTDINISVQDYSFLLMENEFLHKHISLNDSKVTPNPVLEDLRKKLSVANEEVEQLNEMLKKFKDEKENRKGHVTFFREYDPIQGHVGVNLFKIVIDKFDYNDFFAQIRFIKLLNVSVSSTDTLTISGTYHNETGEYKLHLHQLSWESNNREITDLIHFYIRDNELYVFGSHPGLYCGLAYDVLTIVGRAFDDTAISVVSLNRGVINKNELRPDDVFESMDMKKDIGEQNNEKKIKRRWL